MSMLVMNGTDTVLSSGKSVTLSPIVRMRYAMSNAVLSLHPLIKECVVPQLPRVVEKGNAYTVLNAVMEVRWLAVWIVMASEQNVALGAVLRKVQVHH